LGNNGVSTTSVTWRCPRGKSFSAGELELRHRRRPAGLSAWTEFPERIEALPDDQRDVFDLLWYQGLTQAEVAALLKINERSVQRRWQEARIRLYEQLEGRIPGR
jgi:RNA polymerase sigma-70 factor (ECF subfamily)